MALSGWLIDKAIMFLRIVVHVALLGSFLQAQMSRPENDRKTMRLREAQVSLSRSDLESADIERLSVLAQDSSNRFKQLLKVLEAQTESHSLRTYQDGKDLQHSLDDSRRTFSESVVKLVESLAEIAGPESVAVVYQYVFDELWYQGLVNQYQASARRAPAYVSTTRWNPENIPPGVDLNLIRARLDQELSRGNREQSANLKLPRTNRVSPENTEAIRVAPLAIVPEERRAEIREPPWSGLPRAPATRESLIHLLEANSLPVLRFLWLEMAPAFVEFLENR